MNGVHKMPSVSQSREPSRCNSCAKNKVLSLGGEVKKNSSKLDGGLSALTFFFFFLSFFLTFYKRLAAYNMNFCQNQFNILVFISLSLVFKKFKS